jgi:ATP-dependent DNA ligase
MLGVYDQGKLRYVGHTGTGFSDELSTVACADGYERLTGQPLATNQQPTAVEYFHER